MNKNIWVVACLVMLQPQNHLRLHDMVTFCSQEGMEHLCDLGGHWITVGNCCSGYSFMLFLAFERLSRLIFLSLHWVYTKVLLVFLKTKVPCEKRFAHVNCIFLSLLNVKKMWWRHILLVILPVGVQ